MSITVKVEPEDMHSVFNEVIIVLDSDNKAEPKFQYVVKISVNGSYSSRIKIASNPQGFGVMDISKHLEPYVSGSLDLETKDIFKQIPNSYARYNVEAFEEYVLTSNYTSVADDGNGFCQYTFGNDHFFTSEDFITISGSSVAAYDGNQEVTSKISDTVIVTTKPFTATGTGEAVISSNTTTLLPTAVQLSVDKIAYNNCVDWVDVPNWDASDYEAGNSDTKFFTNLKSGTRTSIDSRITLNIFNKVTDNALYLELTTNNGVYRYTNGHSTSINDSKMLSVGVGMFDFMNMFIGAIPGSIGETSTLVCLLGLEGLMFQASFTGTFALCESTNKFNANSTING